MILTKFVFVLAIIEETKAVPGVSILSLIDMVSFFISMVRNFLQEMFWEGILNRRWQNSKTPLCKLLIWRFQHWNILGITQWRSQRRIFGWTSCKRYPNGRWYSAGSKLGTQLFTRGRKSRVSWSQTSFDLSINCYLLNTILSKTSNL